MCVLCAELKNTEVLKHIGQMWRELEDKTPFEAEAAADKERYEAALKRFEAAGGTLARPPHTEGSGQFSLPLQRVKRIAKAHPRVTTITSEGTGAMVRALEMFVSKLASDAAGETAKAGKKTVRYPEMRTHIRRSALRHFLVSSDFPAHE